jgi:hypothetical protein
MRWNATKLALAMMVGLTGSAMVGLAGCATHHGYYAGGDVWSDNETTYYNQWEGETHRPHVEYAQRNAGDQHEYWSWRHSHNDNH